MSVITLVRKPWIENGIKVAKLSCLLCVILFVFTRPSFAGARWDKVWIHTLFTYVTMALILLLAKKPLNVLFTLLLSLLLAVEYTLDSLYGGLSLGVIEAILNTNIAESIEFLSTLNQNAYLVSLSVFVFSYLSMRLLDTATTKKITLCYMTVFFAVYLLMGIYAVRKAQAFDDREPDAEDPSIIQALSPNALLVEKLLHANLLSKYFMALYQFKYAYGVKRETSSCWQNVKVNGQAKKDVYLVVIGESAVKNRFHAYGYEKRTTYDVSGLTVFDGVISPSVLTMLSLPRILAKSNNVYEYDLNLSIVSLAKAADFETYWISNQARTDTGIRAITTLSLQADHRHYSNTQLTFARPDNILLPFIKKTIKDKTKRKKVIFVHTMGSHYDFCERIDPNVMHNFQNNGLMNCYDNSILYTFNFLNSIREILAENNQTYEMIYFSDHGMVTVDHAPYLVHGTGKLFNRKAVEIPFMLFSDNMKEPMKKIKTNYNLINFYTTFSDWLGISADQIDINYSLFGGRLQAASAHTILDSSCKLRDIAPCN